MQRAPVEGGSFRAWFCFLTSVAVEMATALLGIVVLILPLNQDLPWMILAYFALARVVLCLGSSYILSPRWYRSWARCDSVIVGITTSSIAYGFIVFENSKVEVTPYKITTVALYPVFNLAVAGNLRCLLKYFPWRSSLEMIVYKGVRFINCITVVLFQILGKNMDNSNPVLIAYFGAILGLQITLLTLVVSRADELRKEWKTKQDNKAGYETVGLVDLLTEESRKQ